MKKKYVQQNKMIGVRFDPNTMKVLETVAKEKRWSLASTVAWCVEQHLDVAPSRTIGRR